jgi:hypothetical protein
LLQENLNNLQKVVQERETLLKQLAKAKQHELSVIEQV